jgi:hypothetical protein
VGCVNCGQRGDLKEETADKIASAIEQMLDANRMSVTELLKAMMGISAPREYRNFARIGYRAGLKHQIKKMPEPDEAKLTEFLAMIDAFRGAPYKMRSVLKQTIKELPYAPGGPPRKVKPQEERIVCAEIMSLRAEYDTREAIRRVAQKWGASERTIYRIWGKYYPKKKKTPPTPQTRKKA